MTSPRSLGAQELRQVSRQGAAGAGTEAPASSSTKWHKHTLKRKCSPQTLLRKIYINAPSFPLGKGEGL